MVEILGTIGEAARRTPVAAKADLVVVGGGPAGIAAAGAVRSAAAREKIIKGVRGSRI